MKILICMYGGLLTDMLAEKDPRDPKPEPVVFDIDGSPASRPLHEEWDKLAADPAYVPVEFEVRVSSPDAMP